MAGLYKKEKAKKYALRISLLALGCIFLVTALNDIGKSLSSIYMLIAAIGCFVTLFLNLSSKHSGTRSEQAVDVVKAICIAASEVVHAEKSDISELELASVVTSIGRIRGAATDSYEGLVAEFYQHSSMPWSKSVAQGVDALHRFVVLQSIIDVAAKAPAFSQAQAKLIKRIGADLGFEANTVNELLRANENYKGERHQRTKTKKTFGDATKVPGTIAYALGIMELPPTATWKEIKHQYKRLAMQYHPDRAKDKDAAAEKFKELGDAYKLLKEQIDKAAN